MFLKFWKLLAAVLFVVCGAVIAGTNAGPGLLVCAVGFVIYLWWLAPYAKRKAETGESKEPARVALTASDDATRAKELRIQREMLAQQKREFAAMAKCPRCGSTSLSGNKKGFGIGKAVVGAAVAGPLGLMAGNIGARKVWVTCLRCGKRFKR